MSLFLVLIPELQHTPLVLRVRERTPTPFLSDVLYLGLIFEPFKELGLRHVVSELWLNSIPLFGRLGWHLRRTISKWKKPWWKNAPRIDDALPTP